MTRTPRSILLFTDFGAGDPYVGQMKVALLETEPDCLPIDLLHRVPDFDPQAGAHLLDALQRRFARGTVLLCVVDPGVGGSRHPVVIEADGKHYIGPDNGLLSVVAQRAGESRCRRIAWRPAGMSSSFHGRDLFAPVAARLAGGSLPDAWLGPETPLEVLLDPSDVARVIFVDHYGNAMTGMRAAGMDAGTIIRAGGRELRRLRVFGEAPDAEPFWYENSIGLVEIAANRASAAELLGLRVGAPVGIAA